MDEKNPEEPEEETKDEPTEEAAEIPIVVEQ
jgi:hypothetical protein